MRVENVLNNRESSSTIDFLLCAYVYRKVMYMTFYSCLKGILEQGNVNSA